MQGRAHTILTGRGIISPTNARGACSLGHACSLGSCSRSIITLALLFGAISLNLHCSQPTTPAPSAHPYVDQGYKPDVPRFMHGSIFERTDLSNTDPYPVSGYSLVVNLQETGDNANLPTSVRQAMIKHMAFAGFGSHDSLYTNFAPEDVLKDKRVAVVQVVGRLPVGIRRGQKFDLLVHSMPRSHTTSLAHGHLYNTELRVRGLELPEGGGMTLAYADAGDVFVNPEYALEGTSKPYIHSTPAQVTASLCSGIVLSAGRATEDRPIFLQLRVPQASIARAIEYRVVNRFPTDEADRPAAAAQDEGLVELYVPLSYNGDWQHFVGVVNHLFLNSSPDFDAQKTRQLIAEAHKPKAPLADISFCLEGLGANVIPIYQSMITDPDPAIAYAAARAAVYCGDAGAFEALAQMATDPNSTFQLAAIHTLGSLPQSPALDHRIEPLLASDKALVRIEAYKILSAHGDLRIITQDIQGKFKLDIIDTPGAPLIYAARTGQPRIAIFGANAGLAPPVIFAAMQDRLTISSDDMGRMLTIFYRGDHTNKPISVQSRTDLVEVISRLGGNSSPGEDHFLFSYPDVVAIMQALSDARLIVSTDTSGAAPQLAQTPFVLDQPAELTDALVNAALDSRPQSSDPIHARPTGGASNSTDSAVDTALATTPGQSDSPSSVPNFGGPSQPAPAAAGGTPGSAGGASGAGAGDSGAAASPSVPNFGNP